MKHMIKRALSIVLVGIVAYYIYWQQTEVKESVFEPYLTSAQEVFEKYGYEDDFQENRVGVYEEQIEDDVTYYLSFQADISKNLSIHFSMNAVKGFSTIHVKYIKISFSALGVDTVLNLSDEEIEEGKEMLLDLTEAVLEIKLDREAIDEYLQISNQVENIEYIESLEPFIIEGENAFNCFFSRKDHNYGERNKHIYCEFTNYKQ